jgi:hypothetical protein
MLSPRVVRLVSCVLVAGAAALPLGCAGSPRGEAFQPEVVQPDQAVMYIYREPRTMGGKPVRVTVNQQEVAELRPGQYVATVVTPGAFLVRAEGSASSGARELKMKAGDVAYLRISGNAKPEVDEPEPDVARRSIARTTQITR